jgi:hypothetical protein
VARSVPPISKNALAEKPNMPASTTAGNCSMAVLYSETALLKKRRAAAILFSRSASSFWSYRKFWFAFRSG